MTHILEILASTQKLMCTNDTHSCTCYAVQTGLNLNSKDYWVPIMWTPGQRQHQCTWGGSVPLHVQCVYIPQPSKFSGKCLKIYLILWNSTTEIPDCQGRVAIVTGGNKGIGLETVKGLCKAHMSVVMGMFCP